MMPSVVSAGKQQQRGAICFAEMEHRACACACAPAAARGIVDALREHPLLFIFCLTFLLRWCGSSVHSRQAYAKKGAGKGGAQKSKKFELTEEQKQEIREAFDLFDTDGSGASLTRPVRQRIVCAPRAQRRGETHTCTAGAHFISSCSARPIFVLLTLTPRHHRREGAEGGDARPGL